MSWCGERIGDTKLLDIRTGRRMPHIAGLIGTAPSGHVAVWTYKSSSLSVWKSADDVPPEVRAPAIAPERRQAELKTRTDKFRNILAGSIRFDEERQALAGAVFELAELGAEAVPVLTPPVFEPMGRGGRWLDSSGLSPRRFGATIHRCGTGAGPPQQWQFL